MSVKTKKGRSGLIIGIGMITVGVIGFGLLYSKAAKASKANAPYVPPNKENEGTPNAGGGASNGTGGGSTKPTSKFPLKNGSRDASGTYGYVIRLQNALNGLGKGLVADGIFGSKTQAALQSVTGKTQVDSLSELEAIEAKQYHVPTNMSVSQTLDYLKKSSGLDKIFG